MSNPGWRKPIHWLAASRGGSWILLRILPPMDRLVFRLSRGKQTLVSMIAGLPSILVTSTGAKSGQPRITPLVGVPEGNGFIVIGSNFGQKHHPAWVYNLRAHPNVRAGLNGKTGEYIAREVSGEERQRLWDKALTYYQGYNAYDARAGRLIAVFMLEPKL